MPHDPGQYRRLRAAAMRSLAGVSAATAALGLATACASAQQTTPPGGPLSPQPPAAVGLPEQPSFLRPLPSPPAGSSQAAQPTSGGGVRAGSEFYAGGGNAAKLLGTPVSRVFPGDVQIKPGAVSPVGDSPQAIDRGMRYFVAFNCVGCHAPNGGGGMGPSLSNNVFLYGSDPAQIYLTIYQGRPRGMPAWGAMLPDNIIWDIVAYVRNISKEPLQTWGRTVSKDSPQLEQVPAEYLATTDPWSATKSFSNGQKPNAAK